MAQKIEVQLIDDLDGSAATETITFGYEGVEYEIDLNEVNAERLKDILRIHAEHARRISGRKARSTNKVKSGGPSEAQTIREWVRAQGHTISDRGRIPQKWVEEYHQSKNAPQETTQAPEEAPVAEDKPKRVRKAAAKPKTPEFKEALAEVLTLEQPKTTRTRRTTTARKKPSTAK